MRSRFRAVSGDYRSDLSTLLDRAESIAADLPATKLLDAIARTARLDAVLRSRYAVLLVPSPPVATPSDSEAARYLSPAAAGRYLGVSRSTVVRLTKAGALPCDRPSEGVVRYDRRELDAYMQRHRSTQLPP